jgi:hypothetical protein
MKAKMFRRLVVPVVLFGAAFSLSGCFYTYNFNTHPGDPTHPIYGLDSSATANVIWDCTKAKGTGAPRALCVLDSVGALCRLTHYLSDSGCNHISSYSDWKSMNRSINWVLGVYPGVDLDCLAFDWMQGTFPPDEWGASAKGDLGCT